VPFAGQVAVARAALGGEAGWPVGWLLVLSLVSSLALTWILLRAAAAALADEELLFRGPDSAAGLVARPAPRDRPTPMQGFAVTLVALAALWYAQGIAPADPAAGVPLQQAALLLPLAAAVLWQRVDGRDTFGLVWPARPGSTLVAAMAVGAGLFVTGAAALLALRDPSVSPAARDLAERLLSLVLDRPWWVGWLVVVILPAIAEELFFRGWVLAALAGGRPARGRACAAVLLQAAAFAAFHLLPERMPQTFLLGVVLGWMTLATGSILPAIVAHAAHNAVPLVFLASAAGGGDPLLAADGTLPGWLAIAALTAVLGGLWLIGRRRS
jgi:sodium transport system permease protein